MLLGQKRRRQPPHGRERPHEGFLPGPARRESQKRASGRTGDAPGQSEESPPDRLGGEAALPGQLRRLAAQVVSEHLQGQPGGIGAELPRRQMVEAHPVFQITDDVLDLGMAAVIGFKLQSVTLSV